MVAYSPPDHVLLTVGGSFRTEPLLAASRRILALMKQDVAELAEVGIARDSAAKLAGEIKELEGIANDPRAKKHDTPLQMNELAELMGRVRAWLATLRSIAAINLALDTPSLLRISSTAPELGEGYGRDLLGELEARIEAARDMKPRLEESGLSDQFLGRGRTLAAQLKTAIGPKDIDAGNLHFTVRRLYVRKGSIYLVVKRVVRAGQLAFMLKPEHARLYHLEEIEPRFVEPFKAAAAKKS